MRKEDIKPGEFYAVHPHGGPAGYRTPQRAKADKYIPVHDQKRTRQYRDGTTHDYNVQIPAAYRLLLDNGNTIDLPTRHVWEPWSKTVAAAEEKMKAAIVREAEVRLAWEGRDKLIHQYPELIERLNLFDLTAALEGGVGRYGPPSTKITVSIETIEKMLRKLEGSI